MLSESLPSNWQVAAFTQISGERVSHLSVTTNNYISWAKKVRRCMQNTEGHVKSDINSRAQDKQPKPCVIEKVKHMLIMKQIYSQMRYMKS